MTAGRPPRPSLPPRSRFAQHWTLDPDVVFLNHGSFGATPRVVQEAQARWRSRLEAEPVRFMVEDLFDEMNAVRAAFAERCGGDAADYVMVHNASTAVATVLSNLSFEPGDELLTTTHGYRACVNNLHRTAERWGARVIEAPLPWPCPSPDAAFDAVVSRVTDRTRFAMLDHVTSPTALVLPVDRLVGELDRRGIDTLVDGAHAPGMLPVDLSRTRPAYYTANAHKWFCAPKGSAFLYVRPDRQEDFRPLVLSNDARSVEPAFLPQRSRFNHEFDYAGTDDPTAWLATPDAIRFLAGLLPGGFDELMPTNRSLALGARRLVAARLGVDLPCPEEMIGSIATVPLPSYPAETAERLARRPTRYADALQDALLERHRVQVPVWSVQQPDGTRLRFVRLSAQLYNTIDQYAYLADALVEEIGAEREY
ncbi:MAG: aminotransferase class V-fold PLP-dependent enzyme [Planctomycetota bacterium]